MFSRCEDVVVPNNGNGSNTLSQTALYFNYSAVPPALSHLSVVEFLSALPALSLMLALLLRLHFGYLAYKSLGPGGTPSTPTGFLKVTILSIFAVKNPYRAPTNAIKASPSPAYLGELLRREGNRPVVKGIAPHRQITQKASENNHQQLVAVLTRICQHDNSAMIGTSCIERHGMALFHKSCTRENEICHIHASDGSMHIVVGEADMKTILEAKWGERHPLAHGGWFERFVPAGFTLIYAPRDHAEVETVGFIVEAAAKHFTVQIEQQ